MSVKLDQLKTEIDALSDDEIAVLRDYLSECLIQRIIISQSNSDRSVGFSPRPTTEEIEQELLEIFSPDLHRRN